MDLEFHQLDRRYEQLRASCRERDSRVLSSLARHGQQLPVVVVTGGDDGRYILVDGYKRVRALLELSRDTVRATCWDLSEDEALLLGRLMQTAEGDSALEQAWLLRELRDRFALSVEELARRFDRSPSWVSRRLGLVCELPEPIQQHVREGKLVPHAAMKSLLPLARANRQGAIELATAIAPLRPSTRQTEALCVAFARGSEEAREYLLHQPQLFLRARETGDQALPVGPGELLLQDLGALGGIARRARGRVTAGAVRDLTPPEHNELRRRADTARGEVERLFGKLEKEMDDAGRRDEDNHPQAS
jgi:ParB family chromosome partitioning protein